MYNLFSTCILTTYKIVCLEKNLEAAFLFLRRQDLETHQSLVSFVTVEITKGIW